MTVCKRVKKGNGKFLYVYVCSNIHYFILPSLLFYSLFPGCSPVSRELTEQLKGVREAYAKYVKK